MIQEKQGDNDTTRFDGGNDAILEKLLGYRSFTKTQRKNKLIKVKRL